MMRTGAQILVDALIKEKVEVMFGYPGGVLLPIYDELYDSPIKHILTRHEQGAVHAADGYARASGKVGVCIATSGPGASNLVTGIANAYLDSVPLVAITGQVPTSLIGGDAFQEVDITGITRPIVKHNYLVKDVKDFPRIIKEAFYLARTGRPGPVLIDIPKDVAVAKTDKKYPDKVNIRGYKPTYYGHPGQIKKAARLIKESRRPVIYAGGGVIISGAHKELYKFATKCNIPVLTSLMGKGGFPETHSLSLGMVGMHGTAYANLVIHNADLIIAIGARFADRVTGKVDEFAPYAKIIHIDIDPASVSKNVPVDIPIVGDVKNVLKELLKVVEKPDTKEWLKQIEKWKKQYPLEVKQKMSGKIKPQFVVQKIYELTKGKAIITTEVGQNQMWAAMFYKYTEPRTFITSGGLGTMGYGFPAAIGVQFARPDKVVFDIAGDGSIQMNIQELATAVEHKLPIKIAILNNNYLGMVRQWQELFFNKRYSHTYLGSANPDFVKIAEAYGAMGLIAEKPKDVEKVLKEALKIKNRPVIMDFIVEEEENVFPMVPAGAPVHKMIMG